MARIDSLLEEIKSLLQTASAVGREFGHYLIQKVTGFAEQKLLSHLSALKDSELIYERGIYPQSTYIFKHALTQEVAYDSLLLKRRKEIHEQVGTAIEALYRKRLEEHSELLAYHYARSTNTEKALQYLDLANQKTAKLNAMEEAKAYFDEAMELLDTLPEDEKNSQRRISLLVNQGQTFMMLLMMPEYYDLLTHYESMARELGNPELLGAFYARKGDCEYWFAEFDRAIQTLTKAVELCEAAGSAEEAARAHLRLEWSNYMRAEFDRALALKEELIRIMEQRSNLRWHPYALTIASRVYGCFGCWKEAVEEAKKAVSIAEDLSDNSLISWSAWNLSIAYNWKGDFARAIEYGELALRKAPTPGDKALAQRGLGWALCRAGESNRGIELLLAVQPILRAGLTASEIPLMCYLGEGYWLAGEDDKARQTLEKGLEIMERCGVRFYGGFAQRLLGEIALKTNPAQDGNPLAAPHFEKSIAIFQEIKAENELALAYAGYGRLHKQKGQIAQAREYLAKALEIFEQLKTPSEPEKIKEILAELPEAQAMENIKYERS